jgi:MFS family permease
MIMVTFTGAPLGGFLGGQIVALLLAHYDWPVIFILGGVFPLVLVLALALWLPESPRFLARKQNLSPRQAALLHRLDIAPTQDHAVDVAQGNPVRLLFSEGYALQTVLLWIIYFCSLLNLFLFAYWMPTVLTMIGMSPPQAVFASSLRDFGALFAVLYLGLAIDRVGPERMLALHYAIGAVFIAVIALVALPYAMLLVMSFLAGMTIIGSQTGANGTCGNTGSCTFKVTVQDSLPPVFGPAPDVNANVAPGGSSVVTYTNPTATDAVAGVVTVNCTPASGSTFPIGSTLVSCSASDPSGHSASTTFHVIVADHTPPVITVPADITVSNDAGVCGAIVSFTPTASDNCPGVTFLLHRLVSRQSAEGVDVGLLVQQFPPSSSAKADDSVNSDACDCCR